MEIDSNNDLSAEQMRMFLSELNNSDLILICFNSLEIVSTKAKLKQDFSTNSELYDYCKDSNSNKRITFASEKSLLFITAYDYTWWNSNTRRLNKLFKDTTTSDVANTSFTIGIAKMCNSTLSDIQIITGSKADVISKLNTIIKRLTIADKSSKCIAVNLHYDTDQSNWHLLSELIENGELVV